MTKESTEAAAAAADIVPSPLCHDDATKTCREFTLEAIGQTDRCRSRRRKEARPAIVSAAAASPELLDRPRRRPFTAQDELRILAEAGGIGAIVRRDGLSVAALPNRRRQPAAGVFVALGRPSEAAKPPNKTRWRRSLRNRGGTTSCGSRGWSAPKRLSNFKKVAARDR